MAKSQLASILQYLGQLKDPTRARDQTDRQLLQAFCSSRNPDAFAAMVQAHGPMVLRVCQHVLRHAEDAEDAFQATFIVLARKAPSIKWRESLPSWLHGVAYRIAVSSLRSATRRRALEAQAQARPQQDPSSDISWREVQALLDEEIMRLPEKYRVPFVLCYLEGRSQAETALQLGLKEGTIWSRLAKARRRLQERLARRGIALSAVLSAVAVSKSDASVVVSARLANTTVQAALHYVAGGLMSRAPISANVASLAQGRLTSMFLTKLKIVFALSIVLGLATAGAGMVAKQFAGRLEGMPQASAAEQEELASQGEAVRTDRFGDPLPPGAVARLGTVRFRHRVLTRGFLAFSRDGKTLLSGSDSEGIVRLWDAQTGREIRRFRALTTPFGNLALAPDQKLVAALDGGRNIALWDVETGKLRREMVAPESSKVNRGAFSPDGRTLATSAVRSEEICLWDLDSGRLIRQIRLQGNRPGPTRLEFSPDGGALISKSSDGLVHFWDLITGKEIRHFPSNENLAPSYAFAPDGKTFATGQRLEIVFWDLVSGEQRAAWNHGDLVVALAYSPDGKTLVSAGHTSLRFWDVKTGKELHRVQGLAIRSAYMLRFSPDGKTLASAGEDSAIRLWGVATGKEREPREGHRSGIYQVVFAPDGRKLATVGGDITVRLWDVATGQPQHVFQGDEWRDIQCASFSPNGQTILAGDQAGTVFFWDTASGKEMKRITHPMNRDTGESHEIYSLALSRDGTALTALAVFNGPQAPGQPSARSNVVISWSQSTGKQVLRHVDPPDRSTIWSLSPDARLRATYNHGALSKVEEVGTWKFLASLDGKCDGLWPIAFSRDDRLLAGVCHHGLQRPLTVVVWELATGKEIRRFATDLKWLEASIALSPDGRILALGGQEETGIQLWDLATNKTMGQFRGYGGTVRSLAFSLRGDRLASGLDNSTALIWDITTLASRVRSNEQNLTTEEQQRLWTELSADDAGTAYAAVWNLIAEREQAVTFLKDRMRPDPGPDTVHINRLIADLDNNSFATREKAAKELEKLGAEVEAPLNRALSGRPSSEVRRRLEAMLAAPRVIRSPNKVRELRAITILEQIGTPEAKKVVETLAKGAPEARLTQEAKASAERMGK